MPRRTALGAATKRLAFADVTNLEALLRSQRAAGARGVRRYARGAMRAPEFVGATRVLEGGLERDVEAGHLVYFEAIYQRGDAESA